MNREIKFRGLTEDGRWLYGGVLEFKDGIRIMPDGEKEGKLVTSPVMPDTVGQYTGFEDKNGLMIFEWDILSNPKMEMGMVVWYNSGLVLRCKRRNGDIFYIPLELGFLLNKEVSGNIHQNPELL